MLERLRLLPWLPQNLFGRRRYLPVWLCAIAGCGISGFAGFQVWKGERHAKLELFQQEAHNLTMTLQKTITEHLQVPQDIDLFYETTYFLAAAERSEFQEYALPQLQQNPGLLAVGWIQYIREETRTNYEQDLRQENFAEFGIWGWNENGKAARLPSKSRYFPITYIEPSQFRNMVGYDLITDPLQEAAMAKAEKTKKIVVTEKLVLPDGAGLGFASYSPVFRRVKSNNLTANSSRELVGFAYTLYSLPALIKAALTQMSLNDIEFYLYDQSASAADSFILFYNPSVKDLELSPGEKNLVNAREGGWLCAETPVCEVSLNVADRQWQLVILPTPQFGGRESGSVATLAIGFLLTAILVVYLWMSLDRTGRIESLVQELRHKNIALQQSEAELREQATRKELLNLLAEKIRNSLDIDTVLASAVQELRKALQVERCCFAWYRTDGVEPAWEVVTESQPEEWLPLVGIYPVSSIGKEFEQLLHRQSWQVDDVATLADPLTQDWLSKLGVNSLAIVPVRTQFGQMGAAICFSHGKVSHAWTEREMELLSAVAAQLSIALNQAELYNETRAKAAELKIALDQLQQTQTQLVQHEKMSALGQLVAGIAHEINNPITFIAGNITYAEEYIADLLEIIEFYQQRFPEVAETEDIFQEIDLDFITSDLPKILASMKSGADRIKNIVLSLRNFSRLDEADVKEVDIHSGIESALMLLDSRLHHYQEDDAASGSSKPPIQIVKEYGNLPKIECYPSQLNQVFFNLLANAIDAVTLVEAEHNYQPRILIATKFIPENTDNESSEPARVAILVKDNGCGIKPEVKERIFDPFFTTKPVGRGTGMGLSISYKVVVEMHKGQLSCSSEPDMGSEFCIEIPVRQSSLQPQALAAGVAGI